MSADHVTRQIRLTRYSVSHQSRGSFLGSGWNVIQYFLIPSDEELWEYYSHGGMDLRDWAMDVVVHV